MSAIDLYDLLPEVHRMEDAGRGRVLAALLDAVAAQMTEVHDDIEGLWDDFFVETCADWVVPYLGDLVGNAALHEVGQRARADVFKTIRYRRRKGTVPTLEEMARDVTRWGAAVVPFFESLEWTQNVNHLRVRPSPATRPLDLAPWNNPAVVERNGTANLRDADRLGLVDGAFDVTSRSVDVRTIGDENGWHNIGNVGVFVWRLRDYSVTGAHPRAAGSAGCFHVSPLGNPMPLFNPEQEVEERQVADELAVPAPIRADAMYFRTAAYYGHGKAVGIYVGGTGEENLVPIGRIVVKDLSTWSPPSPGNVALDVHLGRLAFGTPPTDDAYVAYSYGFAADIGGGPYDRRRLPVGRHDAQLTVARPTALEALIRVPRDATTIADALAIWDPVTAPSVVVQVEDSRTYVESVDVDARAGRVVIQAQNQERPVVVGDIRVRGDIADGVVTLDGLTVAGRVLVGTTLRELRIIHCTLVPGVALADDGAAVRPDEPSVLVDPGNVDTQVTIEACIVGPVRMPAEAPGLVLRDSIVDSPGRNGPRARHVPVLVSAQNPSFGGLTSERPRLRVASESFGPFTVEITGEPTTLADLGDAIERAVRATHTAASFAGARVLGVPGRRRLVLLSGGPDALTITAADGDPTARESGLEGEGVYQTTALVGASRAWAPLRTSAVELLVDDGAGEAHTLRFDSTAPTLARFRGELQQHLRAASGSEVFASALVARDGHRLVVVPGTSGHSFTVSGTDADPTTVLERGLDLPLPAVAAGTRPRDFGPRASLERCTVFGPVLARTLDATDVIFAEQTAVERRQLGCVRFSWLSPGSQTPRRYRCQPDLVLETVRGAQRLVVAARMRPRFTSLHYGDPAYAQLSRTCPDEIRTGAEDGAEMGAFAHLRQPQRETNLRIRLEEYLPFGLRAGVVFVT